jgi:hypothetical protein
LFWAIAVDPAKCKNAPIETGAIRKRILIIWVLNKCRCITVT